MKKIILPFVIITSINVTAQRHQRQESLNIKKVQLHNSEVKLKLSAKGIPSYSQPRPSCDVSFKCISTATQKQPLFVIDRIISTYDDFIKIKPKHIIEIILIKSEEAIPIYGRDAEEGAIIVTTKNDVMVKLEEINRKQDSILNLTYPTPGALRKPKPTGLF